MYICRFVFLCTCVCVYNVFCYNVCGVSVYDVGAGTICIPECDARILLNDVYSKFCLNPDYFVLGLDSS